MAFQEFAVEDIDRFIIEIEHLAGILRDIKAEMRKSDSISVVAQLATHDIYVPRLRLQFESSLARIRAFGCDLSMQDRVLSDIPKYERPQTKTRKPKKSSRKKDR